MAITYIPQQPGAIDKFSEGFSPYLQMAFQALLKKKMDEQQQQQNLQQAQTMFPSAFTPTLNAAGQNYSNQNPAMAEAPTPMQGMANQQGQIPVRPEMSTIPDKYKSMMFNPQEAQQYPGLGINFSTGAMEYKVPSSTPTIGVYSADQSGGITKTGEVPRGAKVLTPTQLETPSQKQERELETTQKKKTQEVTGEMKSIDNMVDVVWKQANALIPAQEGLSQAATTGVGRKLGTTIPGRILGMGDENAIAFSEFQEGTLSMLIRSLGEKGVLTDQDIKRARQFEPSFYDTPNIRTLKRNSMAEFLKSKVNAYTQDSTQTQGVPSVGQAFNGERVIGVRRIE